MPDLKSKRLIVAKGVLFLCIAVVAFLLLLLESPLPRTAVLASVLVWASCRFYYFLFYVLEKYVDPTLRYAGILALLRAVVARGRASFPKAPEDNPWACGSCRQWCTGLARPRVLGVTVKVGRRVASRVAVQVP